MTQEIGVGLVGYKFMGRAHSNAYRQVAAFFPEVKLRPALRALCGRDEAGVAAAAAQFGWQSSETDWRRLVARDDIGLVDISTPGDSHGPIALEAAAAGKHILCEKPLANTLAEARQMAEAAERAGVINMVMFNYRRVPAVQLARRLVESGRLGTIYHWRAVYLQDWIMDPNFPLVWRLRKEVAGSGALGDLGAHIVDLARFLIGEISEVTGLTHTFIKQRPLEASSDSALGAKAGTGMGEVTVDDAALFLARFATGALGSFEVTRFAKGRLNGNNFEINGSKGSLRFNLERLNELEVLLEDDQGDVAGWRTINVTNGSHHPYVGNWWPVGHIIGYEHTFTHAVHDFLNGIASGVSPAPTFADGVRCQAVLEAVEQSAGSRQWVEPAY